MEHIFVLTAIVGFIEFIKALFEGDLEKALIIIGAAIIGGLCGFLGIEGLSIQTGIEVGLSAAGAYKGLSLVGGTQSTKLSTFPQTNVKIDTKTTIDPSTTST